MKRLYIAACCIVAILVIGVIVSINLYEEYSFDGIEKIYTIKTNYTHNVSDDNKIEILCYSNDPKSFLKEYDDVLGTFRSEDDKTVLSASITNVKRVSIHDYNDQRVYGYKLYVEPVDISFTFDIKDCIFETRDFTVVIGNLTLVKMSNKSSDLDFSKIYAIGNEYMGFKSITGFVVTFTNKGNTPINVYDFYIGEFNYCSLADAKILDKDISYGEDIKNYITDYKPYTYTEKNGSIQVLAKESVKVLIPVYYTNKAFLGNSLVYINNEVYIDNYNYLTNNDDLDMYDGIVIEAELSNIR